MKVEIWSDIACPFCYIGKRRLENALEQFPNKEQVEIVWHSFELDPNAKYDEGKDIHDILSAKYGRDRDWAIQMSEQVSAMAKEEGLDFDFSKNVPANTFNAHRLIHLANKHGKQDEAKERLLKAYFTEGQDVDSKQVLVKLGEEIGLNTIEIEKMLDSDEFGYDVRVDEQEANHIGVRGVPFFVVNRKYGISGAQPLEVFTDTLNKAWSEEHPLEIVNDNGVGMCSPDGTCEV
ncbi:disulfide bond formation protein DsbA [Solitalea longa]|uniref:Disulfide bond formation protein DsbA n=1 Tax=Solitalea longa TaxID=2079460 RepID=A0A2S5A8M6_9SPHI|nr:DsbA family oxidoreductase [Solitalea longa]POY38950.1 disulfide bond formation protein DsbA [Solitalea longa]